MKFNDFKNATMDAVSFFPGIVFPVKTVFLVYFDCSFNTSITLAPPYMQPNCDLFSAKIKRLIILIHHANYQIRNNDRKINDLQWSFRYHTFVLYIVCMHLLLLFASAITLHSIGMMFTLIIFISTSNSCHCRGSTRFNENPTSESMILSNLSDRRIWSRFSLLLARITSENSSSSLPFASWEGKISRFRYSSISRNLYDPSGMTISSP